jgi:hypothetical protein
MKGYIISGIQQVGIGVHDLKKHGMVYKIIRNGLPDI